MILIDIYQRDCFNRSDISVGKVIGRYDQSVPACVRRILEIIQEIVMVVISIHDFACAENDAIPILGRGDNDGISQTAPEPVLRMRTVRP